MMRVYTRLMKSRANRLLSLRKIRREIAHWRNRQSHLCNWASAHNSFRCRLRRW